MSSITSRVILRTNSNVTATACIAGRAIGWKQSSNNGIRSWILRRGFHSNHRQPLLVVPSSSTATTASTATATTITTRSNSNYSSKYEYPLATEPPEITRTYASDVAKDRYRNYANPQPQTNSDSPTPTNASNDPFDDQQILSPAEIQDILQKQKLSINTKPTGTVPITETVPSFVPKLIVPSTSTNNDINDIPRTHITTLDNGIRIVSKNTYGSQVCTVGVVCELGSRIENTNLSSKTRGPYYGMTNVLEMLTFKSSTDLYSGQQITDLLQDWGGTRFVNTSREQTLICIDLLRPNLDNAITMLNEVIVHPKFEDTEIDDCKATLQYSFDSMPPDILLGEALQIAAYGTDQQLGQRHFAIHDSSEPFLQSITSDACKDYWTKQLLSNPKGIVIGGTGGIEHDFLVDMIQSRTDFGSLQQNDQDRIPIIPSIYRGGECRYQLPNPLDQNNNNNMDTLSMPVSSTFEEQNMVKVAIALEVGGWQDNSEEHQQDLVTICVLQTLLGGGSSFSAGGPGKGMYSRLYREILNRYTWAESAEAFTSFHNESGLFGIMGTTSPYPQDVIDMTFVLSDHIARLAHEKVTAEELFRAKNMLKNNVLTQLESRLVLFEDISRQVLTYGKHEDMETTIAKIQNVTAEDIQNVIRKSVAKKPMTVACVGIDLSSVPAYTEIQSWFTNDFQK